MKLEELLKIAGEATQPLAPPYDPYFRGVLRFYGNKIRYDAVRGIMDEMEEYIKAQNAQMTGEFAILVHKAAVAMGTLSLEIYAPINKEIKSAKKFVYFNKVRKTTCMMATYQGFFLKPRAEYLKDIQDDIKRLSKMD